MTRALPEPAALESAISQALSQSESFVLESYSQILRVLVALATKKKDKGAAELILKHVISPLRQREQEKSDAHRSSPIPLMAQVACNDFSIRLGQSPTMIVLNKTTFDDLPAAQQEQLRGRADIQVVDADSPLPLLNPPNIPADADGPTLSQPSASVGTVGKQPNKTCDCGAAYYSSQPLCRKCPACRATKERARLQAYLSTKKAKRCRPKCKGKKP